MAASKLTALGQPLFVPDDFRCCLCRKPNASRGFGDRFYCTPCVPPSMRFPWEPGYEAPEGVPLRPFPAVEETVAPDLFSGFSSA